jgi:hypothetical protein
MLPKRLLGVVLLTEQRLLFSGRFLVPRTPSRLWAINDALQGGGTNYAQRAAQFVERRDIHAAGDCALEWVYAVQLERANNELINAGVSPSLGFVTMQKDSVSCVSVRPLDDPVSPWSVHLQGAQSIVRFIAQIRSRNNPGNDTLRMLAGEARYEIPAPECVGWEIPYSVEVPGR